jgi:hypothetical protein
MYEQPYAKMKDGAMPQIPVPGEVSRGLLLLLLLLLLLPTDVAAAVLASYQLRRQARGRLQQYSTAVRMCGGAARAAAGAATRVQSVLRALRRPCATQRTADCFCKGCG